MSCSHKPEDSISFQGTSDEVLNLDSIDDPNLNNTGGANLKSDIQFDNRRVVALAEKIVLPQKKLVLEFFQLLKYRISFSDVIKPYLEIEADMFSIHLEMICCQEKLLKDHKIMIAGASVLEKLKKHSERYLNQLDQIQNAFKAHEESILSKNENLYNEINKMFQNPTLTYKEQARMILLYAKSVSGYTDLFKIHEDFCNSWAKCSLVYSDTFSKFGRNVQNSATNISTNKELLLTQARKLRNDSIELKCHVEIFNLHKVNSNLHHKTVKNLSVSLAVTLKFLMNSVKKLEEMRHYT